MAGKQITKVAKQMEYKHKQTHNNHVNNYHDM